eukprot:CAMPEP_0173390236 /NCGR_PEP_ID=MMETSP1356-20130122/14371_1 /TAXON_ID=77927 ORGANISM="Hemiselmis virescens, Strain PCC157" /NCGR_SAMPLE_ID=MMETSP1356 /ASSEMBLY_ACC=CAM_ASM_000847 /LENGTH=146 /DNA_ID=CAMNT_0014347569 /DNA_START=108 /DNA_END=544 /DNA_ORIENTATION=-
MGRKGLKTFMAVGAGSPIQTRHAHLSALLPCPSHRTRSQTSPLCLHCDANAFARCERHVILDVFSALDRFGVAPRRVGDELSLDSHMVPHLLAPGSPPPLGRILKRTDGAVLDGEVNPPVGHLAPASLCHHRAACPGHGPHAALQP